MHLEGAILLICLFSARRREIERQDALWKIPFYELKLVQHKVSCFLRNYCKTGTNALTP